MTEFANSEFWDYIVTDNKGNMIGVRDDMPDSARNDYEAFIKEQKLAKQLNMKV